MNNSTQMLTTLLVDDEKLTLNTYIQALNAIAEENPKLSFSILTAENCDKAISIIDNVNKHITINFAIIDLRLPASSKGEIISGDDIGHKLKKRFKDIKLIIITSHNDNYRLYNLLKTLNPFSVLVKSDIDFKELSLAITNVINNTPYYSKTVGNLIRKQLANQIILDKIDRKILYHISIGTKMKDLPPIVNLSMGGIERRKRLLRDIFNTKQKDDRSLIEKAKVSGFI